MPSCARLASSSSRVRSRERVETIGLRPSSASRCIAGGIASSWPSMGEVRSITSRPDLCAWPEEVFMERGAGVLDEDAATGGLEPIPDATGRAGGIVMMD